MESNELMIGDWVKVEDNFTTKITAIFGEMVQTQAEYQSEIDGEWYGEAEIKDLHPIPLTSEILEKNGFNCEEIIQLHWISEDGRILLRNDESLISSNNKWSVHVDNEDMQTIGYFELTYVHQLQHALRLCEIEKEIEL